jgi:hypothetical protein
MTPISWTRSAGATVWRLLRRAHIATRTAVVGALERHAGIHTGGVIHLEQLGFAPDRGVRYVQSQWFTLHRILKRREVTRDDVFVDFGAGKGLVVYQAARRYRFRRVEGVELSPDLTTIAQANIDRTRDRLACRDVRLVTGDALALEVPDDMTVAYFYNPFGGEVFAGVLEHILASLRRNPRRLRVICLNPVEERQLLDAGFKPVRQRRGLRPGRAWSQQKTTRLYEIQPEPAPA